MKIAVYNEKGGAGKTTLAVNLALAFPAALVDLDPQRTATRWLARRDPPISTFTNLQAAEVSGGDIVIDFAPGIDLVKAKMLEVVDLVLIPVRATFADLDTIENTVQMIAAAGRPAAFVVTSLDAATREAKEISDVLSQHGIPIFGILTHRVSYGRSGIVGKAAYEIGDRTPKMEIDWILKKVKNA